MKTTVKLTPQQSLTIEAFNQMRKAQKRSEILARDYQAQANRLNKDEIGYVVEYTSEKLFAE